MLAFKTYGSFSNKSLIFFHGFLGTGEDWGKTVRYLTDQYYCISLDLPGHGKTPISSNVSFFQMAKMFLDFLEKEKIQHPILLGYSMGGRIAHFLHQHLLRKNLCICIGSHLGLLSIREKKIRISWRKIWEDLLDHETIEVFLQKWYRQDLFKDFVAHSSFERILKKRALQNAHSLKEALIAFCVTKQGILKTDKNTFFLCGEKDHKYRKYYRRQACKFDTVPKSSHAPHLENPKLLAMKIKEVLYEKAI